MNQDFLLDLRRQAAAESMLGIRAWTLLRSYGRLMCGQHSGRYVSSRPAAEQLDYAHRLLAGETLPIHLMHRHRSGNYESSTLQYRDGTLVMVFRDRVELA